MEAILMLLVWLLILLLIGGLVWWALGRIASTYGIPPQVMTPIEIVLVIIFVLLVMIWLVPMIPSVGHLSAPR